MELNELATATYAELDILCLTIIATIGTIARFYARKVGRNFNGLLYLTGICYCCYLLVDAIWVVAEYTQSINTAGLYAINIIYFLCLLAASYSWLAYTIKNLEYKFHERHWPYILIGIPIMIVSTMVIASFSNHSIFYVQDGKYQRGEQWLAFGLVNYGYIGISSLLSIIKAKTYPKKRLDAIVGACFGFPVLVCALFQALFGYNLICVGFMVSLLLLFTFEMWKMGELHKKATSDVSSMQERIIRQEAEAEKSLIIQSLGADFEGICYVFVGDEAGNDIVEPYRMGGKISELLPEWDQEKNFRRRLDMIENELVEDEEKINFHEKTKRGAILGDLETVPAYFVDFKVKGKDVYFQIKFTADKKDGQIKGLIVGIHDVSDEIFASQSLLKMESKIAEQKIFTNLFVDTYISAYYVDAVDFTYSIYKQDQDIKNRYGRIFNYKEAVSTYINEDIHPDDKKYVIEASDVDYIKNRLKHEEFFAIVFRYLRNNEYTYIKMRIIRGHDENHFAIGFLDVDSEYKKELAEKEKLEAAVKERTYELQKKNAVLNSMTEDVIELLGDVVESRDEVSGEHIQRVKGFTYILATQVSEDYPEYGLSKHDVNLIMYASALHDVGKIAIPDSILLKPDRLTDAEYEIMKSHCERGCDLIRPMKNWSQEFMKFCLDICMYHHERYDGMGYPKGLKGDDIPIAAQIVAVADAYDALTSHRPYKDALEYEKAYQMIADGECGVFSEKILSSLEKVKGQYAAYASSPTVFASLDALYESRTNIK